MYTVQKVDISNFFTRKLVCCRFKSCSPHMKKKESEILLGGIDSLLEATNSRSLDWPAWARKMKQSIITFCDMAKPLAKIDEKETQVLNLKKDQ